MKDTSRYSKYVKMALDFGASEAKIIETSTIKTASWTSLRCRYGCPGYRSSLCCPPNTPSAEETQKAIDDYSYALLARFPSSAELSHIPDIEHSAFLDGYYKAFSFKAGSCKLCEKCNLRSCVHPGEARPSMEGAGIDVYETVHRNGFPLEVLKTRGDKLSFFGLVLIE